jgi:hypothetical protein
LLRLEGLTTSMPLRGGYQTTIRRRNAILSAVNAIFQKKTHKFGIELPTSINHVRELDRVNENNLWMEALQKEMFNMGIAFEVLEDRASAPKGWNKATGHINETLRWIFQEKLEGYWRATSRLTLKYVRLISAMPISRHHPPRRTRSYAALSLE